MTEKKTRGRPEHDATDENREKVRVLKAGGMIDAAIAEVIGISIPTLTKHYFLDLEIGAAKVQADVMMARYRAAMGGNVSAQTKMLEAMGGVSPRRTGRAPLTPAGVKLGKKEQAEADAVDAHEGGKWANLIN